MMSGKGKILVTMIIALAGFTSLKAQDSFSITGHLKSQTGEPVPFANVALYDSLENIVTGAASDINGDFILSGVKEGLFNIQIQFVGYDTWSQSNVLINADINLGSIVMQESSEVLNEVVIRGEVMERPFEVSPEGITINPAQNLANAGGSVVDVLRNTPSINVDAEGAISLRGSSSTNVLINGRNSSLAANLDQIPASAVKSIKVINNPGAKC